MGKNDMDKVTAAVLNYNYAERLHARIKSILDQTYPVYELLILDDKSTDNSLEVIQKEIEQIKKKYPNLKISCELNKKNSGNVFKQWAKAFELSTGDYLWICEADDLCEKEFLETVMHGFKDDKVVLSYTESCTVNLHGTMIEDNLTIWNEMFDTKKWSHDYINDGKKEITEVLCVKNTIPNVSGVVFKKDPQINFQKYLKGAQQFRLTGDWYTYNNILMHGKIAYFAKPLNCHCMHSDSVLGSTDDKLHLREEQANQKYAAKLVKVSKKTQAIIDQYNDELKSYVKFNMGNIKLSVLAPIYNAEKYLAQSLDSLVNQTLKEIEIICINDGSTDNSLKIIKQYMKKDSRIVLINKKNSGYGDSMNQGLEKATGQYIGILEPDDWIELDAFEKMYQRAKELKAEVVCANYFHHRNGIDTMHRVAPANMDGRLSDPAVEPFIFLEPPAIWSSIYSHELLYRNKINFLTTPGASYQDTSFNFKVLATAHSVTYLDQAFVHYRLDNESSSVNQPDKVMNVSKEFAEIEKYLKDKKLIYNLGGLMEWVKFRTYYWNLQRLSSKLAEDFIDVMRREFSQAEREGLLQKIYFRTKEKLAYQIIMNNDKKTIVKLIKTRKKIRGGE